MRPSLLLALLLGVAACDEADGTDACGVPNAELSMVATAVDNGVDIHAEIDFAEGARDLPRPLALCAGDELTIAGMTAERIDRADGVAYVATLAVDAPRAIPIRLARVDAPAIELALELAPAFTITAPVPAQEISRSADFMLGWDPALPGAQLRISLAEEIGYGVCLETGIAEHDYKSETGVDVDDDGGWNIPATAIDGGTRDKCDATYRLTRFTTPAYPGELHESGYLEGRVERSVAFVSVP